MKQKRKHYHMHMDSVGASSCAALMGAAFFLRAVYYFGFTRTENVGLGELMLFLILPVILEVTFMIALRGMRLDAPGLYGILGAAYCALLMFQSFQYDTPVRIILAVIAYIACGGILFGVVAGYLSREIAVTLFFLTATVRFLFVFGPYILKLHLIAFLPEAAGLCAVLALGCLSMGLSKK